MCCQASLCFMYINSMLRSILTGRYSCYHYFADEEIEVQECKFPKVTWEVLESSSRRKYIKISIAIISR